MPGLVLELQRDALDKSVDVPDLLRKAMVVSKKLGINEIEEWINRELSGYPADKGITPFYRKISGMVKYFNPQNGWQPMIFEDAEYGEELSKKTILQPMGELNALVNSGKPDVLQMPFSQKIRMELISSMPVPLEATLLVDRSQVHGILEAVRNEILNWALDLESKGIVGDGMSFSTKEKEVASQVTYQITNNIGSMQNSQLQQESAGATQNLSVMQSITEVSKFVEDLKASLNNLEIEKDKLSELGIEASTIELQLTSPKPKSIVIEESLKSIRSILEGVTGSVLANELLTQLANFF